jgi:hypothetical protein
MEFSYCWCTNGHYDLTCSGSITGSLGGHGRVAGEVDGGSGHGCSDEGSSQDDEILEREGRHDDGERWGGDRRLDDYCCICEALSIYVCVGMWRILWFHSSRRQRTVPLDVKENMREHLVSTVSMWASAEV